MKTILTTIFAFALVVVAFSANPVMAGGGDSGLFGSLNEPVDELRELDEDNAGKTAFGGWQAVLEACKDENGDWDTNACPYLKEAEGESKSASLVCRQTPNGELVCCSFDDQGKFEGCEVANEAGNESQIAQRPDVWGAFCEEQPDVFICVDDWWNEDAESRDGFGGRAVADSGNEGSTSAASADEQ